MKLNWVIRLFRRFDDFESRHPFIRHTLYVTYIYRWSRTMKMEWRMQEKEKTETWNDALGYPLVIWKMCICYQIQVRSISNNRVQWNRLHSGGCIYVCMCVGKALTEILGIMYVAEWKRMVESIFCDFAIWKVSFGIL